jgi:Ca2+-binding EF-hand superfamily protein
MTSFFKRPLPLIAIALGLAAMSIASVQAGGGQPGRHAKADANGDGVIDRNEAAAHPKLAENFDRLDVDKDGRIDAGERPQRRQRGEGGGKRGERMAQLDTDGDGRFSRQELAGRERILQNFAAIDGNADGFLSREEMRAHHRMHGGQKQGGRQPGTQATP